MPVSAPSIYRLLLLVLLGIFSAQVMAARNILFIAIDDLRVEPQAITPNIDAFAAQSTRYNNAYASVPVCLGSRVSVLTGMQPSTHQVGLTGLGTGGFNALFNDPNVTTLPEEMAAAGYTTATTGKVNHSTFPAKWDLAVPYVHIDSFHEPLGAGPDGTYFTLVMLPEETIHPDQWVANWAVDYIENYDDPQPFFLAIGFSQPHVPWVLPQWAWDMYPAPIPYTPVPGDLDDEPQAAIDLANRPFSPQGVSQYDMVLDAGKVADYTRAYLAATSHTDVVLGEVLAALAASPHAATTDIVVWSDHGYHLGEKYHWRKSTFWEHAVKAPLYIQSPAIPAGDVDVEVSLIDLAPTVLDLAGATAPAQFEGVSLRTGHSPVEIYYDNGKATVSNGTKVIDYDVDVGGWDDRAEYYLPDDPYELNNLVPPPGC